MRKSMYVAGQDFGDHIYLAQNVAGGVGFAQIKANEINDQPDLKKAKIYKLTEYKRKRK